jgi:hypothetical protein
MVLHTIINERDIFYNEENILPTEFKNISNGQVEYRVYNGQKQVVRLHSTDPYMYLKSEYMPFSNLN